MWLIVMFPTPPLISTSGVSVKKVAFSRHIQPDTDDQTLMLTMLTSLKSYKPLYALEMFKLSIS